MNPLSEVKMKTVSSSLPARRSVVTSSLDEVVDREQALEPASVEDFELGDPLLGQLRVVAQEARLVLDVPAR